MLSTLDLDNRFYVLTGSIMIILSIAFGDHRMAMAFAVAGLVARGETIVDGAESIPVSYPGFVEDMRKLGAKIELIE